MRSGTFLQTGREGRMAARKKATLSAQFDLSQLRSNKQWFETQGMVNRKME